MPHNHEAELRTTVPMGKKYEIVYLESQDCEGRHRSISRDRLPSSQAKYQAPDSVKEIHVHRK